MSNSKTLYLIRHGETDYNRKGIIQGSGVDSDLNETGRRQAEMFFRAYHHLPFDRIYTSELKRTHQSVHPFIEKGLPHQSLPELNEINWGIFEGQVGNPDSAKIYERVINDWRNGLLDRTVEGGETPNQLQKRQKAGLEYLLNRKEESLILVCMHGRAMRSFLSLMLNQDLSQMDNFRHSNLCLYVLRYEQDSGFEMLIENSTEHLWI
jgi:broad specificity phosphatase PhoE